MGTFSSYVALNVSFIRDASYDYLGSVLIIWNIWLKTQKVLLVGSILDALYFPLDKKEVKVEPKSKACFTILKCGYLVLPLASGSVLLTYVTHGTSLVTRVSVQSQRLRIPVPFVSVWQLPNFPVFRPWHRWDNCLSYLIRVLWHWLMFVKCFQDQDERYQFVSMWYYYNY